MKKRKISLSAACLALVVALFAGCGAGSSSNPSTASEASVASSAPSEAASTPAAKQYKVAYIARAQSDSFAAWLCNEIKAEAAANYKDITLEVFDGEANDDKENTMIENAIANKFDAIIIQANNGEAQRPYIEKVVAAGIKCITTNPRVSDIKGASSVDAQPYDQGAVNAKAALAQIPQNAKVVVLNGPAGNFHSTERRKAWQAEFFDKRPDIKVLAEDIANWNKDEAMKKMEDWVIAYGAIDAIISMNDNMCAGALEVVSGKDQYKNILSYGVDGTAEACLLIQEGKMTSTALQSAIDLAQLNMKTVHQLLTGEKTDVSVDIPAPIINKDNADQYVEMYKKTGLIK
ncbi:MAG: sugar ABC transporter substrate-binding protein [Herbinix sp.]|nr:sugar ABC transporter substrate-binding protein [Herbinix sp.]